MFLTMKIYLCDARECSDYDQRADRDQELLSPEPIIQLNLTEEKNGMGTQRISTINKKRFLLNRGINLTLKQLNLEAGSRNEICLGPTLNF